eukprot:7029362-Prymnesium_polylepis.2
MRGGCSCELITATIYKVKHALAVLKLQAVTLTVVGAATLVSRSCLELVEWTKRSPKTTSHTSQHY